MLTLHSLFAAESPAHDVVAAAAGAGGVVFAAVNDFTSDGLIVGGAGLLAFLFRAYFREVKRKDEGVWEIVEAKGRQIEQERIDHARELAAMTADRDYYRAKLLGLPVDETRERATPHDA